MNKQRLEYLFQKYFDKTANHYEREELKQYIYETSDEEVTSLMKKAYDTLEDNESFSLPDKSNEILNAVFSAESNPIDVEIISQDIIKRKSWYKYLSIAAFLLISITVSMLFYNHYAVSQVNNSLADIEPGGNKAILTLANGTTIDLDNVANGGEVVNETGVRVSKTEEGYLVYDLSDLPVTENAALVYHSIKTPRGGQYQLILPDGSKVWLNAESTLKYPTAFSKKERRVELYGEGYFEVTANKEAPFIVKTNRQEVTVLGTQFNVNSYKENPVVKTTLLEGSIQINSLQKREQDKAFSKMLKPGEEAVLNAANDLRINTVDVSNSIAWKNGLFRFENTNIKEVMEEFSRWYNVEVEFEGAVPDIKLWGRVYRNVSATEALGILEYFNLKFRIVKEPGNGSDKKVIISHI